MKHTKLLVTVLTAVALLCGAGVASAQHGGGGGHGGGGWSGGGGHGGGGWSGGGGGWHGGGGWNGGGGWHGGSGWHGGNGWHGGGCWNCGWHGSFGVWLGVPGAWWWPGYYPYPYYGYYGYPYYGYPYYASTPVYDVGPQVYIQRDAPAVEAAPVAPQGGPAYYYCSDPAGYYPQVANCSRPWTKVIPNSPPPTAPQ